MVFDYCGYYIGGFRVTSDGYYAVDRGPHPTLPWRRLWFYLSPGDRIVCPD